MSQKERFDSMAMEYDAYVPMMVPYHEDVQEQICSILSLIGKRSLRVLDVGAGSGILLQQISRKYKTESVWQDFSDDFFTVAKNRLRGENASFVISDLGNPEWHSEIKGKFDAIVSSNAIHHLKDQRKKELYNELVQLLAPGGMLLNADEIRGESDASYLLSLRFWDSHVRKQCAEGLISRKMQDTWEAFTKRNLENFPNNDPDRKDIHCRLPLQIEWLRAAGLEGVECFWRRYLWAVFGGMKPISEQEN